MPYTLDDPAEMARRLHEEADAAYLDELVAELTSLRSAGALRMVATLWGLSQTDMADLFGVSRQAVSKWLRDGVPSDRATAVADLARMTDLLARHLKQDRIPAVVRTPAPALRGSSLVELVATGDTSEALELTRRMFVFGDTHR